MCMYTKTVYQDILLKNKTLINHACSFKRWSTKQRHHTKEHRDRLPVTALSPLRECWQTVLKQRSYTNKWLPEIAVCRWCLCIEQTVNFKVQSVHNQKHSHDVHLCKERHHKYYVMTCVHAKQRLKTWQMDLKHSHIKHVHTSALSELHIIIQ